MKTLELIAMLVDISGEGKIGELRERWAYARREVCEHDGIAMVHARLDARNIGVASHELLGIDVDEATDAALELIAPNPLRAAAIEVIEELHAELFEKEQEQAEQPATNKPPKRRRDW